MISPLRSTGLDVARVSVPLRAGRLRFERATRLHRHHDPHVGAAETKGRALGPWTVRWGRGSEGRMPLPRPLEKRSMLRACVPRCVMDVSGILQAVVLSCPTIEVPFLPARAGLSPSPSRPGARRPGRRGPASASGERRGHPHAEPSAHGRSDSRIPARSVTPPSSCAARRARARSPGRRTGGLPPPRRASCGTARRAGSSRARRRPCPRTRRDR